MCLQEVISLLVTSTVWCNSVTNIDIVEQQWKADDVPPTSSDDTSGTCAVLLIGCICTVVLCYIVYYTYVGTSVIIQDGDIRDITNMCNP